jgi:hypothetical protein
MPWYYAGPEAKPVGPVSLEQLQAMRAAGTVSPETYVLEHTGQPIADWTWKRYRDVFPSAPYLPPVIPTIPEPVIAPIPPPPPVPAPTAAAHPLFPSAGSPIPPPIFTPTFQPGPHYQPVRPTNGWCGWGFALGLIGLVFSFACIGLIPALISLVLCIVGLVKVGKNPSQSGRGLAIAGVCLSGFALLISIVILCFAIPNMKFHEMTVTEQTSSDSD